MQLSHNCLIATGDKKLEIFDLRKGCTLDEDSAKIKLKNLT